jgi:hypothetical protein
MLINTSGSGKTRLLLDGLCRNWGFYFTAIRDSTPIGSDDFRLAMEGLDKSLGYKKATMLMNDPRAMDDIKQKTHRRLMELLLARFILLKLFIQEARRLPDGLDVKNHRRAWVLLQVQPCQLFGEDIFHSLTTLLRRESLEDLELDIQAHYKALEDILERPATRTLGRVPIYCVVDESQDLGSSRKGRIVGEDLETKRPLFRQVYLSFTRILPSEHMITIFSGTGIDYQSLAEVLHFQFLKPYPYEIIKDVGAFEDREIQARYIQHYLKVDWTKPNWSAFLDRAWGWCRGRYH